MPQQDGLIVLSGGMDSVTLLYEYQANIALAISFDYGSKHNAQEIPYAHGSVLPQRPSSGWR